MTTVDGRQYDMWLPVLGPCLFSKDLWLPVWGLVLTLIVSVLNFGSFLSVSSFISYAIESRPRASLSGSAGLTNLDVY